MHSIQQRAHHSQHYHHVSKTTFQSISLAISTRDSIVLTLPRDKETNHAWIENKIVFMILSNHMDLSYSFTQCPGCPSPVWPGPHLPSLPGIGDLFKHLPLLSLLVFRKKLWLAIGIQDKVWVQFRWNKGSILNSGKAEAAAAAVGEAPGRGGERQGETGQEKSKNGDNKERYFRRRIIQIPSEVVGNSIVRFPAPLVSWGTWLGIPLLVPGTQRSQV